MYVYTLIRITMYFTKLLHSIHLIANTHNTRDVWARGLDDLDHLPRLPRWATHWGPKAENFLTQGLSLPYEILDPHGCCLHFECMI